MKRVLIFIALFCFIALISTDLAAQCPMCKMAAESDLKNGGTAGRGLNAGILYMLSLPYVLVGTIAFLWWRNRKRAEDDTTVIAESHEFSKN
jgi:hypothetical protein